MWIDNNLPGVPELGGVYPFANDWFAVTLPLTGGADLIASRGGPAVPEIFR